jgi:hypothetical protein
MQTQSKVLKWSLIIGMVVVINLFFNYALSLIYKQPDYNNFCQPVPVEVPSGSVSAINTQYITCQNNFQTAENNYDRNVFITLVILGALCVALGSFLGGNAVISIALSLAGVLSFIIASMRYWSSADDLIKVIILAIALLVLFWVAFKKFGNNLKDERI